MLSRVVLPPELVVDMSCGVSHVMCVFVESVVYEVVVFNM